MHLISSLLAVAMLFVSVANAEEKFIGKFTNYHHGIAGEVYAVDEQTLKIKGFEYDGAGPDAFFWAGTSGANPGTVGIILPHPFDGTFYDYEDRSAPILEGRFDKVDLTLTLPPGTQVSDLKWLSVWCRAFKVNFGDLVADFTLDDHEGSDAEAESESEPETTDDIDAHHPPLVSPENAHDPHHRHHHDHDHHHGHDEDADAEGYAEGEAEGEAESEAEAESAPVYGTGSEKRPLGLAVVLSAVIALALW